MRLAFRLGSWFSGLFLAVSVQAGAPAGKFCPNHLRAKQVLGFDVRRLEKKINDRIGRRGLYKTVLSSDLDFLKNEVKVDGPGAQRNMHIEPPAKQFRINAETRSIFALKKSLLARYPEKILGVAPDFAKDVQAAVAEQFAFVLDEFPKVHPTAYRREGDTLENLLTGDRLSPKELARMDAKSALESLGKFVPDDLIFMKKVGEEYRLIGGNLAFPTRWNIEGALGASIGEIHALLVGTSHGVAEFSAMINKILDRTLSLSDIPCRNNWFLEWDPRYAMPSYLTVDYASPPVTKRNYLKSVFIRTERQSLRGLPKSRTVLFGIQPFVYPLAGVMEDRDLAEQVLKRIRAKFGSGATRDDFGIRIAKYMEEDLGPDPNRIETRVVESAKVNDTTYRLSLEKPAGISLMAGEAVRVTFETPTGPETRTLSLANSPNAGNFEFATKDSDSAFKRAFKSAIPGTKVKLELLRSGLKFKTDRPMVMIAGGIGITPFRSVIQEVQAKGLDTKMWLLYGNRDEIAFGDELTTAARSNSRLKVTNVLSRPTAAWTGTKGRIDKAFLQGFVPTVPSDARYYIVATPQMTEDVRAALIEFGIPEERISIEVFPNPVEKSGTPAAAFDPKAVRDCDTVCYCHRVNAGQIREAARNGATSVEAIQAATRAGTGCGGCLANIMKLLACELVPTP